MVQEKRVVSLSAHPQREERSVSLCQYLLSGSSAQVTLALPAVLSSREVVGSAIWTNHYVRLLSQSLAGRYLSHRVSIRPNYIILMPLIGSTLTMQQRWHMEAM